MGKRTYKVTLEIWEEIPGNWNNDLPKHRIMNSFTHHVTEEMYYAINSRVNAHLGKPQD